MRMKKENVGETVEKEGETYDFFVGSTKLIEKRWYAARVVAGQYVTPIVLLIAVTAE